MRHDCTIDGKQVICRNSSGIGYSSNVARVGYFFIYSGGHVAQLARMLGRVRADGKTYILAMVLMSNAHSAFERWVDPDDVLECYEKPPTRLAEFFFAPTIPYDVHMMRRLMEHGTIQDPYVDGHAERVQEFKARGEKA